MATTLNIFYVRRDVSSYDHCVWSEHKTFATIFNELKYEDMLRDKHKYALRYNFNSRDICVNVEHKED